MVFRGTAKSPFSYRRDANRQVLAYVYFEEEPGRRAAARLLTRDGRGELP